MSSGSGGSNFVSWRLLNQLKNLIYRSQSSILQKLYKKETVIFYNTKGKENNSSKTEDDKPATSNLSLHEKSNINETSIQPDEQHGEKSNALGYGDIKRAFSYIHTYIPQLPQILPSTSNEKSSSLTKASELPKWALRKKEKTSISRSSIDARTKHLVNGLESGVKKGVTLRRLEELCSHLKQYPNTKGAAVKKSGISRLIQITHQTDCENTKELARQALALLGYMNPVQMHGIRILSIDGGGVRGLVALDILSCLERLSGQRIHKLFDFICGVSTGAVVAVLIGVHRLPLKECKELYRKISNDIFSQPRLKGTASLISKNSFYDSDAWGQILRENMGEIPLIDTTKQADMNKLCLVSTLAKNHCVRPFLFRNYEFPYRVASRYAGCWSAEVWEAIRASAAAPGYFSEYKFQDLGLLDGGVMVNNPTAIAIHEARKLWSGTTIQTVVSLGTGRHEPMDCENASPMTWASRAMTIINSATDTEGVHTALHDLLPGDSYFRLNPYLSEETSLDEIREEKLSLILEDTALYLRQNEAMMEDAVKSLMQKKSWIDLMLDTVMLQKYLRNL